MTKLAGAIAFALLALNAPATSLTAAPLAPEARSDGACGVEYYVNFRGHCVHRPIRADGPPAGATARCRDGTYSFSQGRHGTCNWHDGVAAWL